MAVNLNDGVLKGVVLSKTEKEKWNREETGRWGLPQEAKSGGRSLQEAKQEERRVSGLVFLPNFNFFHNSIHSSSLFLCHFSGSTN